MQVPTPIIDTIIRPVILRDEGGFVLTKNENDNDGGWTFAGITAKVWNEHVGGAAVSPDEWIGYDEFKMDLESARETGETAVIEIYYERYYQQLEFHLGKGLVIPAYLFSCAINCGVMTAVECYHDSDGIKEHFLWNWTQYYAGLVVKNAKAWQECVNMLQHGVKVVPPKTLRAANLKGWLHRVERYR